MRSPKALGKKIEIRQADALSASLIAALTKAADLDPWSAEAVGKILALPGSFGLLALGPRPVGFVLVQVAADKSEIVNIAIEPESRHQGIGRMLLSDAMEHARKAGARAIFLEVARENAAARSLYKRQGFVQVGMRPDYYLKNPIDYTDALILRCKLITTGSV